MKKVFGAKRAGITGDWRKLHDEDLYDLYSFRNLLGLSYRER
jgi:hypothetical protein